MAEAEDVITDAARHATIFARALWRRHRPAPAGPVPLRLADVAQRLDLLIAAVFGRSFALRVAQPPATPSWIGRMLLRHQLPPVRDAFPATDGRSIWLPATSGLAEPDTVAVERFRTMALQQAMRVVRGSAAGAGSDATPLVRDLYLLIEAHAADAALVQLLPGMRARRSGCIANVTSISGKLASSPMSAYAASKFALEAVSECLAQEVKPFGIRVCVVEPGIIDTDMARHISVAGDASVYPNQRRMAAMFTAALQQPVPPSLVADKLVAIADGGSWQFRHPVGPDAAPFLQWRASLSDEAWVEWGALDDDTWYARVQADFGMDVRPCVV